MIVQLLLSFQKGYLIYDHLKYLTSTYAIPHHIFSTWSSSNNSSWYQNAHKHGFLLSLYILRFRNMTIGFLDVYSDTNLFGVLPS